MTAKELLERARDRLKKPNAWTQNANARNERGEPVGADAEDAVKWCAHGALDCEARIAALETEDPERGQPYDIARRALYRSVKRMPLERIKRMPLERSLLTFNDCPLTFCDDVVRLFDEAIEAVVG